ncbi:MAG TPA: polysaccharide pyruvyl transferase family protein [Candidatus Saccharimonadales bacterium]|nr:polysaccharide pyruvyl transferase family protein [Candidatus Saccharimonadales bacterium]
MTIEQALRTYDFEKSVLVGYYGGGNYGDELLLEILANKLQARGIKHVTIAYQNPRTYTTFHHDFGYPRIAMYNRRQLLRTVLKNKTIVVGGGGLWGLDVNPNILLLSMLLFCSRWLLRKRVYMLGVGYYNSTSRIGNLSAWLAGKSATHIIARDSETYQNFRAVTKHVSQDTDLAWLIPALDLQPYEQDSARLMALLPVNRKTIFITLRRFRPNQKNTYLEAVEGYLASNQETDIILALMEPQDVDAEGYRLIRSWQKAYKNIRITDFSCNPLALYLFFREHQNKLAFIGPQFHMIITAYLNHVPYLPVAYDNKVLSLFQQIGQKRVIPIRTLSTSDLQAFAGKFMEGRR